MTFAATIIIILLSVCILGSCDPKHHNRYGRTAVDADMIPSFPDQHKLSGITGISHSQAYCITTCIQMIGEWAGITEPIEYYNWLTAYSYGAFYKDRFVTFMPISDVMNGITFGASHLGLRRDLYGTGDSQLITNCIKSLISQDYPVMIFYDYNVHTEDSFFFPHAALLTGYDENNFFYIEPGFSNKFVRNETHFSRAPIETFLRGIKSFHKNFGLGDGYSCLVFRKGEKRYDESKIWARNAGELGGIQVPMINIATGSKACLALAKEIRNNEIPEWGWKKLLPVWFSFGRYSRSDNAAFIAARFGKEAPYGTLIDSFNKSSALYADIIMILENPALNESDYSTRIPPLLEMIAQTESDAGKTMAEAWPLSSK